MKPLKLINKVQNYSWGTVDYIPDLLGLKRNGEPWAELWIGNHPKAPSVAILDNKKLSLDYLFSKYPEDMLGKDERKFGGKLPFLFKVLSAGRPLSIQAHPDKLRAEKGFLDENERSVPLDAFDRNYKDDNHKPEIICALTPFTAMCGFRTEDAIEDNFMKLNSCVFTDLLLPAMMSDKQKVISSFFAALMELKPPDLKLLINSTLEWAENETVPEAVLVRKFAGLYDLDPGILAPLYLNVIMLKPGEALYQGSGELHAYVEGTGIELMANSDNVLRGGLTPKHVDVKELLNILTFTGGSNTILKPQYESPGCYSYQTPSYDFELRLLLVEGEKLLERKNSNSVEILLCTKGDVTLSCTDETLFLSRGESALIPASVGTYTLKGPAELYSAGIPQGSR